MNPEIMAPRAHAFSVVAIIVVLTLVITLVATAARAQAAPWPCSQQPIEPCAKRHGRLSTQNGITTTIWIIGTTRRVAVVNPEALSPRVPETYLSMTSPDHAYIFGDFDICPVEPDRPGHLKYVCVAGAEKLVVQPHDTDRVRRRPAFRLAGTWPRP